MPSASIIAGLLEGGDILGVDLLNPNPSDWMVVDSVTSQLIIKPDTVTRFDYGNESRISDYPVEEGAFTSYNKVSTPYDIRMTMVCGGQNFVQKSAGALGLTDLLGISQGQPMTRQDFLDTLEYMLSTLDLFDIVTPDKTYKTCNLVHYDYQRRSNRGVKLLAVDCLFREVRVTSTATYSNIQSSVSVNSNSPSASNVSNVGSASTYAYGSNASSAGVFQ